MPNNYEIDLIYPIVAAAAKLAGLDYHTADARQQTSLKVTHHTYYCWYLETLTLTSEFRCQIQAVSQLKEL